MDMIRGPTFGSAIRYKIWSAKGVAQKLGHAFLVWFFGPKLGPTKWPAPTQNMGVDWQATSMPRIGDGLENHATKRTLMEPLQGPKLGPFFGLQNRPALSKYDGGWSRFPASSFGWHL